MRNQFIFFGKVLILIGSSYTCSAKHLLKTHTDIAMNSWPPFGICEKNSVHNSPLHVVLWVSLSGTLSGTLRIVFQSHLVLCGSIRLIVRNDFVFCFLHYFSNFFSKFWYFIIVINPTFLANFKNSLTPWIRSKLPKI